jgi:glycosyltransferase involved in cell wall biosynthesis
MHRRGSGLRRAQPEGAAPGPRDRLPNGRPAHIFGVNKDMIHSLPTVCFPFVGDLVGGSHLSVLGLVRNLDLARFRPLIFVQNSSSAIAALFRDNGIPVEVAPPSPALTHGARLGFTDLVRLAANFRGLSTALRRRGIDIVHTNDGRSHATWAVPARMAGTGFVWHHRASADALGLRYCAPFLADEVISVSEYAISRPWLFRARSTQVIHSPFCTLTHHDRGAARRALTDEIGCGSEARLIGFSGVLIDRKRPLLFVDAVAALQRLRPNIPIHGVMFGEALDVTPEMIMARARALNLDNAIHVLGFRKQGARCLAGCDALLVPAIDEPFGRTLIEAMLVGTPVVATRSGGNIEALRGGSLGLLVEPEDTEAMARKLASLLDQPHFCEALTTLAGEAARARFGETRHATQIMAIYDRLIARRAKRAIP